jgi:hypothetical protein
LRRKSKSMQELLGITMLLGYLQGVIPRIIDHRQPSPNKKYSIMDAVMSAFSIFFFQCESFLEYQKQLNSRKGRDNAQTLFGVIKIPTDAQIRNILDPINPNVLFDVFIKVYRLLKSQGVLKQYEVLGGQLLIPLDGTEYFSSQCINCDKCSHRKHRNGSVTYFHSAILPVIVSPKLEHVISLDPEFITPQDGHTKQDCEASAAKRWIERHAEIFEPGAMTLLGDDLFSRQPMCQLAIQSGFHYIFVCLPSSHLTLYEWLEYLGRIGEVNSYQERHRHGRDWHLYQYRWINRIPLRDAQPALETNWFELIITRQSDGQILFQNSWITDHLVSVSNIVELSQAGRARWKTENENHNVLKTQGYHLEHNFGHGSQFLASFLVTLNLLAFLFHTVLHLVDVKYQQVRQQIGTRKRFFQDLRALTTYFVFDRWLHLFSFMLDEFEPLETANSS